MKVNSNGQKKAWFHSSANNETLPWKDRRKGKNILKNLSGDPRSVFCFIRKLRLAALPFRP